jgi:hypothetical protein
MEWRTELHVSESKNKITISDSIFTIGSCFSDEVGTFLLERKFNVCKNPFGTVYNTVSIHELLISALNKVFPRNESYSLNNDIHFNYNFHSSFSSLDRNELEDRIKNAITESNQFLSRATRVIITYGTAFVYKLKPANEVVANCHKMPSANFEKELLSESEIIKSFDRFYSALRLLNPQAKIIITVSPVRHLKDTLELNAVSKSILRTSCHAIAARFSDVEYFPAYEILLDDLRDYRFYKPDRLHPTTEAVEYIWQKFLGAYVDEPARKFITDWTKIKNDLAHRPFNVNSQSHQNFLIALLAKLENLGSQVDVSKEIQYVKSYLVPRKS